MPGVEDPRLSVRVEDGGEGGGCKEGDWARELAGALGL